MEGLYEAFSIVGGLPVGAGFVREIRAFSGSAVPGVFEGFKIFSLLGESAISAGYPVSM